jgi:hypothetical protein
MYMTQLEFKLYIERCREWVRERERERKEGQKVEQQNKNL